MTLWPSTLKPDPRQLSLRDIGTVVQSRLPSSLALSALADTDASTVFSKSFLIAEPVRRLPEAGGHLPQEIWLCTRGPADQQL